MLQPGRNDIRYDALVAVSSVPENQSATGALPVPVYDLPAELLCYTLPSQSAIPTGCSISLGSILAISPMDMNGCRPSATGFTITSDLVPIQRPDSTASDVIGASWCRDFGPWWWLLLQDVQPACPLRLRPSSGHRFCCFRSPGGFPCLL